MLTFDEKPVFCEGYHRLICTRLIPREEALRGNGDLAQAELTGGKLLTCRVKSSSSRAADNGCFVGVVVVVAVIAVVFVVLLIIKLLVVIVVVVVLVDVLAVVVAW